MDVWEDEEEEEEGEELVGYEEAKMQGDDRGKSQGTARRKGGLVSVMRIDFISPWIPTELASPARLTTSLTHGSELDGLSHREAT